MGKTENSPGDIFGMQLRMMPTLIKNNGVNSFWSLRKKAKLYCLTLVIEDIDNHFNGSICVDAFPGIGNNEYLNIYKTLYEWEGSSIDEAPDRLFFISSVVKCNKKLKNTTGILEQVKKDKKYLELSHMLSSIVSETATFPFIVNIAIKIMAVIKQYLGKIDDISVATTDHYFNKHHGDLDKTGVLSLRKSPQNVTFDFELIIYNKELTMIRVNDTYDKPGLNICTI